MLAMKTQSKIGVRFRLLWPRGCKKGQVPTPAARLRRPGWVRRDRHAMSRPAMPASPGGRGRGEGPADRR